MKAQQVPLSAQEGAADHQTETMVAATQLRRARRCAQAVNDSQNRGHAQAALKMSVCRLRIPEFGSSLGPQQVVALLELIVTSPTKELEEHPADQGPIAPG
jgi:hypothetical protein